MALSPDIMKTYGRIDIAFTHGKGSFLFSEDGSKYLDYATGIAVNAFGHSHPELIHALQDQASKLWHVSNLYKIPEQVFFQFENPLYSIKKLPHKVLLVSQRLLFDQ